MNKAFSKGYIQGYEDKASEKKPMIDIELNADFIGLVCISKNLYEATFRYLYKDGTGRYIFAIGETKANALFNALAEIQYLNATTG